MTLRSIPRVIVGVVCLYEAVSIFSRKVPTVSSMCWKHKVLTPIVIAGLAAHLIVPMVIEAVELDVPID